MPKDKTYICLNCSCVKSKRVWYIILKSLNLMRFNKSRLALKDLIVVCPFAPALLNSSCVYNFPKRCYSDEPIPAALQWDYFSFADDMFNLKEFD